jgi:hypothetical protein
MSYIIKSTSPFVSIKLTQTGRQQLALGKLNFNYWAIGDSELNYEREEVVDSNSASSTLSASSMVLRPVDREPNIQYYIKPSNTTDVFNIIDGGNLNVVKAVVNNAADERGFFSHINTTFTTLTGNTYIAYTQTVANSVLTGGTVLNLTTTSGFSVGDIVYCLLDNNNSYKIINKVSNYNTPKQNKHILDKTAASLLFNNPSNNGMPFVPDMSGQSTYADIGIDPSSSAFDSSMGTYDLSEPYYNLQNTSKKMMPNYGTQMQQQLQQQLGQLNQGGDSGGMRKGQAVPESVLASLLDPKVALKAYRPTLI